VFAVNKTVWNAWSDADRALVRDAAADAAREAHAMARRLAEEDMLAKLGSQGAFVTRLTAAGTDAFRDAARPVYERWTPVIGAELVDAVKRATDVGQQPR
jgi:TRAP-type C4-dicarboxylate transport system substrate-binding protein